jgi:hypothetical protein
MLRAIGVAVALAALALTFIPTEASAQRGFRAGGPVGFRAGPAMGFRGPVGFRAGPGFRGPAFRAAAPGFRVGGPGFRRWAGPGPGFYGRRHFRRGFYPYAAIGFPLAAYGAYSYYNYADDCVAPRRVWTPYGWRVRWVNVCYYGYY